MNKTQKSQAWEESDKERKEREAMWARNTASPALAKKLKAECDVRFESKANKGTVFMR